MSSTQPRSISDEERRLSPRLQLLKSEEVDEAAKVDPHKVHIQAVDLHKSYYKGAHKIPVLRGATLDVQRGEFLAIIGSSGSGKSTLLHLLGTLDRPDQGEVRLEGRRIDNGSARECDTLRNTQFGLIFQFYHLLPEMTALENVLSPAMISDGLFKYWRRRREHEDKAKRLLGTVGLGHRLKHKPRELSGGEMQRTAIARALITGPKVLLADEPTGNLDRAAGNDILKILRSLNEREKLTIVMVTHDLAIAEQADRIVRLTEGRVER